MKPDRVIGTTIPHSSFGGPDCCGCLDGLILGDRAAIECNECGAVISAPSVSNLQRTLDEMELSLVCASAICPHCRAVNLFPGFDEILAFVCNECGRGVSK